MKNRIGGAYDRCLRCEYLGEKCDGPNTLAMTLDRWCEWCRSLRELKGLTSTEVAEKSGVSLATVDRIMNGKPTKDIMRNTAADINRALVGSEGKWPCAMAFEAETPATLKELEMKTEELASLRRSLEEIHGSYTRELDAVRESYRMELEEVRKDARSRIDHLVGEIEHLRSECERKDKLIDKLVK